MQTLSKLFAVAGLPDVSPLPADHPRRQRVRLLPESGAPGDLAAGRERVPQGEMPCVRSQCAAQVRFHLQQLQAHSVQPHVHVPQEQETLQTMLIYFCEWIWGLWGAAGTGDRQQCENAV